MKTDKLKFIRGKVIEAVPEILELKMGCEVEYLGERYLFVEDDPVLEHRLFRDGKTVTKYKVLTKIIGREIRLADIILAIDEGSKKAKYGSGIDRMLTWDIVSLWNIADNNLDNQSEETILFLYEIFR